MKITFETQRKKHVQLSLFFSPTDRSQWDVSWDVAASQNTLLSGHLLTSMIPWHHDWVVNTDTAECCVNILPLLLLSNLILLSLQNLNCHMFKVLFLWSSLWSSLFIMTAVAFSSFKRCFSSNIKEFSYS